MTGRILALAPLVVGLGFLALFIAAQPERVLRGHNDFIQLYTGGQLAGTPDLYSREANLRAVRQTLGFTMETVVYTRPPFYAVLLKPLALLPYQAAYTLYSAGSLAALIWFFARFRKARPELPVLAAMGLPLAITLVTGQDTAYLLASLGAAILLLRKNRDFAAGLVLCCLAIKFHLFVALPLALLCQKRWRVLAGGITGGVALILIGGIQPLIEYIHVLRDPWIHYSSVHMPNLHGVASILNWGPWLEPALIATVAIAFLWFAWGNPNFELVLGASLICGLLFSYHSGIADDIVLYAAAVLIPGEGLERKWMTLMLTPIPFAMVMIGPPWTLVLPCLIFGLFVILILERLRGFDPRG